MGIQGSDFLNPHIYSDNVSVNDSYSVSVSDSDSDNLIITVIFIIDDIISSLAIAVNGIIFLAYCLQRLRKPSYKLTSAGYLVLNLLVADCLGGAACLYVTQFKMWPEKSRAMAEHQYLCPIRFAVAFLGFIGSHFALLSVVIDRYIAVLHTLQYRDWMTKRTCVKMIVVSWIIPVTGAIIIMTKNDWQQDLEWCNTRIIDVFYKFVWLPMTVLVLVLIAIIQAKFHFELSKRARSDSPVAIVLRRVTRKSARVLIQSSTIFIVGWGYFDFAWLADITLKDPEVLPKLFYEISFPMAISSFLFNPVLYSYQTKAIGIPVKNLVLEISDWLIRSKDSPSSSVEWRNYKPPRPCVGGGSRGSRGRGNPKEPGGSCLKISDKTTSEWRGPQMVLAGDRTKSTHASASVVSSPTGCALEKKQGSNLQYRNGCHVY